MPKYECYSVWYSGDQMTKALHVLNRECQSTYYGHVLKKSSKLKNNYR